MLGGAAICNKNANGETFYLAENSQDKWNEIINSDNSKDWKLDGCLRHLSYSSLIDQNVHCIHAIDDD
jgi:hypothetical protein